jgi:hypothetical protein
MIKLPDLGGWTRLWIFFSVLWIGSVCAIFVYNINDFVWLQTFEEVYPSFSHEFGLWPKVLFSSSRPSAAQTAPSPEPINDPLGIYSATESKALQGAPAAMQGADLDLLMDSFQESQPLAAHLPEETKVRPAAKIEQGFIITGYGSESEIVVPQFQFDEAMRYFRMQYFRNALLCALSLPSLIGFFGAGLGWVWRGFGRNSTA